MACSRATCVMGTLSDGGNGMLVLLTDTVVSEAMDDDDICIPN